MFDILNTASKVSIINNLNIVNYRPCREAGAGHHQTEGDQSFLNFYDDFYASNSIRRNVSWRTTARDSINAI